jgi:hypothetical protein
MMEIDYTDYIELDSISNRHEENGRDDLYQDGKNCIKNIRCRYCGLSNLRWKLSIKG